MNRFICIAAVLNVIALAGCNSSTGKQLTGATVFGTVHYKGVAVTGGSVTLVDVNDPNKSMVGQIDGNGEYRVVNAPLGEVKVVVETESAKNDMAELFKKAPEGKVKSISEVPRLKYMKIDEKYGDPEKTDLKFTIAPGEQEHDINLP
jgi:hypothetical protein